MSELKVGVDVHDPSKEIYLPEDSLTRHLHLAGGTGAGKTVAIITLLHQILCNRIRKSAVFVIDPIGNLSRDLLMWIASRHAPEHVRERLVYIEPASDHVLPFNPLRNVNSENHYYAVARAVDLILRAWSAQDLASQPRLMRWSYKALSAMAALKLPIAMSRFLLHPGTREHNAILERIPEDIRFHWLDLLKAKGGDAARVLDSTRNRFEPFFEAPQAMRMFGIFESRFDTEQLIRDRRIVIVNVASLGKIPKLLGSTIGSLIANEVFETTFRMATTQGRRAVEPTYLLLDECQLFLNPDICDALPTCRQMGLRMFLANQSFSQLWQGDLDMRSIIWQARNRLMFANSAEDADIIAEELATLTYDPMAIKDEIYSRRQLITGYRTAWLKSEGESRTHSDTLVDQATVGYGQGTSNARPNGAGKSGLGSTSRQRSENQSRTTGGSSADSSSTSRSRSQHMMPIHETFDELTSRAFLSFPEHFQIWRKTIRQLKTGVAFGRFVDDDDLHQIKVDYEPVIETPTLRRRYEELLARNHTQEYFISAQEADRLADQERVRLLTAPPIQVSPKASGDPSTIRPEPITPVEPTDVTARTPFRRHSRDS